MSSGSERTDPNADEGHHSVNPPPLLSPLPPLFGLLTPIGRDDFSAGLGGTDFSPLDINEQVFMPYQTPLRRSGVAYSPMADDEVLELGSPALEAATQIGKKRKRRSQGKKKRSKKPKKSLQRHVSSSLTEAGKIVRLRPQPSLDPYYAYRYSRVAEMDVSLKKIVENFGQNFFKNKIILQYNCGKCAFIAFYIAAYLGSKRMIACDSNFDNILENLKQLRKFKHDGIRLETSSVSVTDEYPPMLVKRCGTVPISNKPWRVLPQFSVEQDSVVLQEHFPFNIEFQTELSQPRPEKIDIVLLMDYPKQLFVEKGAGGIEEFFVTSIDSLEGVSIVVKIFHWRDVKRSVGGAMSKTAYDFPEFLKSKYKIIEVIGKIWILEKI